MATPTDPLVGSLSKILNGELMPRVPPGQNPELAAYIDRLHEYLRRLFGRFTGENIIQTIINQNTYNTNFAGTFLTDWRYNTTTHKFEVEKTTYDPNLAPSSEWVETSDGQPLYLADVQVDTTYDTGSHILSKNRVQDVYVLEFTGGADTTVDEAEICTAP